MSPQVTVLGPSLLVNKRKHERRQLRVLTVQESVCAKVYVPVLTQLFALGEPLPGNHCEEPNGAAGDPEAARDVHQVSSKE